MPPTIALRKCLPEEPKWALASNETDAGQTGGSGVSIGFISLGPIFAGIILVILLVSIYKRHPLGHQMEEQTSAPIVEPRDSKAAKRAARKKRISEEIESENFSRWRAKQLKLMKTPAALPTQIICAICLSEFKDEDLVRDIACSHVFHVFCLDEWYSRGHNQCPLCKSEFVPFNAAN